MPSCARPAEPNEFMPDDFFRRYRGEDIFGNTKPLEIDLGCGDGTFLLKMAQQYPDRNFLGVERLLGRVRSVCKRITELGLDNAMVLRLESHYTVEWLLAHGSISCLHLLCPDPWPKAKHHKRRIVQQPFLDALHEALTPDGEFLFKTDHPEYFEWVSEQMHLCKKFFPLPWPDDDDPAGFYYPKTDFQQLWESQGKTIYRLRYGKA